MIPISINHVPMHCIHEAAEQIGVPALSIIVVIMTEGGKVGSATKNLNGTFDYGPMQVNTIQLPVIAKYGYSKYDMQYNDCDNVMVGAWVLKKKIVAAKHFWHGIGDYNSRTPTYHDKYVENAYNNYLKFESILTHAARNKNHTIKLGGRA